MNTASSRITAVCFGVALSGVAVTGLALVDSQEARADSSCTTLIANVINRAHQAAVPYEYVAVPNDRSFVAYHRGLLSNEFPEGPGPFGVSAVAQQYYSDRVQGQQRFSVTDPDQVYLRIRPGGVIYIENMRW